MNFISKLFSLVAVALLTTTFSDVVPASAELVTVSYFGTVTSAFDNFGIFGSAAPCCNNPTYVGDSYEAVFVFNTNLGSLSGIPGEGAFNLYGGSNVFPGGATGAYPNGLSSPDVSAIVIVNGVSNSMSGSYDAGLIYNPADPGRPTVLIALASTTPGDTNGITASPTVSNWSSYDGCVPGCAYGQSSDFNASITSYQMSFSATPLPSTWIMMLTGLAAMGLIGWRRKRNAQAVA